MRHSEAYREEVALIHIMVRSSLGSAPLRCLSTSALSVSMTCWAVSRLFCKFKAYTSTVGTLSKVADGLNSMGVADLTFFHDSMGPFTAAARPMPTDMSVDHYTFKVYCELHKALEGLIEK